MVIFHGELLNNQMVYQCISYQHTAQWGVSSSISQVPWKGRIPFPNVLQLHLTQASVQRGGATSRWVNVQRCSTPIFMVTDSDTHQTSLIFDTWSKVRKCQKILSWDISPHFTTISELRCHQFAKNIGCSTFHRALQEKSDRWAEPEAPKRWGWPLFVDPLPSGELTKSYWKWLLIVDFPIKNGDFPLLC